VKMDRSDPDEDYRVIRPENKFRRGLSDASKERREMDPNG
jgi:hypothetical protein